MARLFTSRKETTPILCISLFPILQSGHTSQHTHGTESEAGEGGLDSGTSRGLGAGGSRSSSGGRARSCSTGRGIGGRLVCVASVGQSRGGDTSAVLAVRAVFGRRQLSRGECDVGALEAWSAIDLISRHSRVTHVVETAVGVTVGNNLNGSVHASGNVQTGGELQSTSTDTEVLGSLFLEGRQQSDVEVAARVVSESHQNLDLGRGVTHEELNGSTSDGELGTIRADGVLPTAGECAQDVLIETACSRVDKLEVGRDKRQQGAEEQLDLHVECGVMCVTCMVFRACETRRERWKMAQGKKVIASELVLVGGRLQGNRSHRVYSSAASYLAVIRIRKIE